MQPTNRIDVEPWLEIWSHSENYRENNSKHIFSKLFYYFFLKYCSNTHHVNSFLQDARETALSYKNLNVSLYRAI